MPDARVGSGGNLMKVSVDPARCGRTGYCVKIAPMVFLLPSDGPTRVIDETPNVEFAEIVREAEALCPTKAIRVED